MNRHIKECEEYLKLRMERDKLKHSRKGRIAEIKNLVASDIDNFEENEEDEDEL